MKNLSEVEWGEFKIGTLFTIEKCKCSNVSKLPKGSIPYIGATNRNNGVLGFLKYDPNLITMGNCIAFICDGEGSLGYSIYQRNDFIGSTTVKVGRNNNLNKYILLFITTIADTVRGKYNFGFKRTEEHLKREILLLPITPSGQPDYVFMENYMREIERSLIEKYRTYLAQSMPQMSSWEGGVKSLDEKKWDEFEIGKLFVLIPGKSKGLNHLRKSNEGISYLGATNQNNGVLCQVNKVRKYVQKGNCIAFIRNGEGSMGLSVYKWEDFIATSDISIGYNSKLNRYVGMFITTIADRVRGKYNFGYKRSGSRLAKERLMLPIDETGQPDYAYMESYMRQQEYRCISRYLDLLKSRNVK